MELTNQFPKKIVKKVSKNCLNSYERIPEEIVKAFPNKLTTSIPKKKLPKTIPRRFLKKFPKNMRKELFKDI